MSTTRVEYEVTGDHFVDPSINTWGTPPFYRELRIVFPFWEVQYRHQLAIGGQDAADAWEWSSGLTLAEYKLARCGLDRFYDCNVQVRKLIITTTSPVDVIANIVQMVAPFIAMIPGVGVVASVALTAAAALALGDPIDKAALDIVANALPVGPIRKTFLTSADFAANVYNGEPVDRAALHTTRDLVGTYAGPQGLTAFDAGVAVAQGERVSDETIALARDHVEKTMGFEGAAAFDAGVGVIKGQGAPMILQQIGRDFIFQAGGAELAALYDAGFGLAQGESLQQAGFKFLLQIAKGNDLAEKALHFGDALFRALESGEDIKLVLVRDLLKELRPLGTLARGIQLPKAIDELLKNGDLLSSLSAFDVSQVLNVPEAVAWAAQAAIKQLEDGSYVVDPEVANTLTSPTGGSTTTTLKLASAKLRAMPAYLSTRSDAADASSKYAPLIPEFAHPTAAQVADAIAADAARGDTEAILAAQALDRATRALERQPWIDYYNSL